MKQNLLPPVLHHKDGIDRPVVNGLLALAAIVFAWDVSSLEAQESSARPWFERSIVGMEVGPTGAQWGHSDPTDKQYCRKWDGREIVKKCVEANSEYLVLWLRDGDYAYYNSKLLPKAPGLGSRDPLSEAMKEAKKHDLPIISYCVVQQGGIFMAEHPEWTMRSSGGDPIGRFCYNSSYLEAMKKIVAEQLAYGIDGFHIDMLDQGFGKPYGCWCDTCRKLFNDRFGHDMPDGATWDSDWDDMLQFRYDTSERFEKQLTAYIKSLRSARDGRLQLPRESTIFLRSGTTSRAARRQRRLRHRRDGGLGIQCIGRRPERRVLSGIDTGPAVSSRHPARRAHVSRPNDKTAQ